MSFMKVRQHWGIFGQLKCFKKNVFHDPLFPSTLGKAYMNEYMSIYHRLMHKHMRTHLFLHQN